MRLIGPLSFAVALCAAPLSAQTSWPDWIEAEGHFALGYSDRLTGEEAFLVGDATLRFDAAGLGLPLGFELGLYGRATELDTPHETYGAVTWDLPGGGRFLVGVPRPAYDSFAVSPLEMLFPSLGVDRAGTTRSEATTGAMFANYLPLGIRFQNDTPELRYAVSIHSNSTPDRTIASLGFAAPLGNWTLEGAVEIGTGGGSTDSSSKLRAHTTRGPLSGGVGYYAPELGQDVLELFGRYAVTDRLSVSGVMQVPVAGASDPTAGLALQYALGARGTASLGVATDAGSAAVYSAFLGWSF